MIDPRYGLILAGIGVMFLCAVPRAYRTASWAHGYRDEHGMERPPAMSPSCRRRITLLMVLGLAQLTGGLSWWAFR
jgi:hypothetical protein